MEKITCACGHDNPFGTNICQKCGRPLTEEEKGRKVADMRYDGTAIRSKTYNKSLVDKVWNFFSSVKVGIALIILTLVASSLGTILPQAFFVPAPELEKAQYYEDTYGTIGKIYYQLGFSDLYNSWWFIIIVGMLAISIIVASIDRGIPLHKSLKNQRVKRHESFMKRQRLIAAGTVSEETQGQTLDLVEQKMKQLKYNVRREDNALLAEKGRFARYGPYINHLGLIIFISGVMIRLVPGFYFDGNMWIREGERIAIPGMDGYFLENKDFILDTYAQDENATNAPMMNQGVNAMAKNYQSDVVLYKQPEGALPGDTSELEKVKEYSIRVNHPLKEGDFAIYQMDFKQGELKTMNFNLVNKKDETKSLGRVSIDLTNPQTVYDLGNGVKIELLSYFPDFAGFEDGEPRTASRTPNNPAFIFNMITPEKPQGETSFVAIRQTLEPLGENTYKMKFEGVEMRDVSGLIVRKDKTFPFLYVGAIIFMIGVVIGSYWNHRRLWIQQLEDGRVILAAHVNKNWFSLKKDLDAVTEFAHLPAYIDQLDDEKKSNTQKEGDNIS